jgi:hypothetical protein
MFYSFQISIYDSYFYARFTRLKNVQVADKRLYVKLISKEINI